MAVNDKKNIENVPPKVNSKIPGSPSALFSHDIGTLKLRHSSRQQMKKAKILIENQQVNIINVIISLPVIDAIARGLWK